MSTVLLVILSVLGVSAVLLRLARATARLLVVVAEGTAASGLAEVSARRGDLTALQERRDAAARLRRMRRRRAGAVLLWCLLLVVPLILGEAHRIYPLAALLWLLPLRPVRGT